MSFDSRMLEMLERVGYDPAGAPTINLVFPCSHTVDMIDFFDPLLGAILERDFNFPETREQEVRRTLRELLINARSACNEDPRKFIKYVGYIGDRGFVVHIADQGPGFDVARVISERKAQLPRYDRAQVVAGGYGRNGSESSGSGGVGIYSLLTFADDFTHNLKGNEVAARFDLQK